MARKNLITLGIESSCDETGIGIYTSKDGLISHKLFSQVKLHEEYGGVVPELASRDHIQKTIPLIKDALNDSGVQLHELTGIAYTAGPGLSGALLVGSSIAQSLAWGLDIPALGVHHMEGHLLAPLTGDKQTKLPICCSFSFWWAYFAC